MLASRSKQRQEVQVMLTLRDQSYRTEDFKKAADLYETLASQKSDVAHEDVDLRINNSAVDAQLEWANLGHLVRNKKPGRQDLDAFETAYNAACGSIARGELGQAEILLRRSRGTGWVKELRSTRTDSSTRSMQRSR